MRNRFGIQKLMTLALATAIVTQGCAAASAGGMTTAAGDRQAIDPSIMAAFVQKLPVGTAIRVDRSSGRSVRGTLMKATAQSVIVQPRTRIPEPAMEIPFDDVIRVSPEATNGSNVGRTIGIGLAAGAGATLGVLLILAAIFAD